MSNRIVIEQQTVVVKHSCRVDKQAVISDDNKCGVVDFESNNQHELFYNVWDLLSFIIKTVNDNGFTGSFSDLLSSAVEDKKGMEIDGVWYDHAEIKPLLDKLE